MKKKNQCRTEGYVDRVLSGVKDKMLHVEDEGNDCVLLVDPLSGIEPTISFNLPKVPHPPTYLFLLISVPPPLSQWRLMILFGAC